MKKLENKFEILDITTADIAIAAYGKELNELFENCAIGMMSIITDITKVDKKIEKTIKIEAPDKESLMFNWLNELLFYFDAYNLIFSEFRVKIERINDKFILNATCLGEKIKSKKHEIKAHIKAATYHKMKIEKNDYWKAIVIFDV